MATLCAGKPLLSSPRFLPLLDRLVKFAKRTVQLPRGVSAVANGKKIASAVPSRKSKIAQPASIEGSHCSGALPASGVPKEVFREYQFEKRREVLFGKPIAYKAAISPASFDFPRINPNAAV